MKLLLINFFIAAVFSVEIKKLNSDDPWEAYKTEYKLDFNGQEDIERRKIFEDNVKFINEHNAKESTFKLALNEYAHFVRFIINSLMKSSFPVTNISKLQF